MWTPSWYTSKESPSLQEITNSTDASVVSKFCIIELFHLSTITYCTVVQMGSYQFLLEGTIVQKALVAFHVATDIGLLLPVALQESHVEVGAVILNKPKSSFVVG